jgi:nicotinamide-nucleotide amidase
MKVMLEQTVLPWIGSQRDRDDVYLSHVFQTFGISESALDELVAGAVAEDEGRVAFRAAFPQISLRLTVHGKPDAVAGRLETLSGRVRERLGGFAYGEGDTTMEGVVGELLTQRGLSIAVAESCTGGLSAIASPTSRAARSTSKAASSPTRTRSKRSNGACKRPAADGAVSETPRWKWPRGAQAVSADRPRPSPVAGPDNGTTENRWARCASPSAPTRCRRYQLWKREWLLLSSQVASTAPLPVGATDGRASCGAET